MLKPAQPWFSITSLSLNDNAKKPSNNTCLLWPLIMSLILKQHFMNNNTSPDQYGCTTLDARLCIVMMAEVHLDIARWNYKHTQVPLSSGLYSYSLTSSYQQRNLPDDPPPALYCYLCYITITQNQLCTLISLLSHCRLLSLILYKSIYQSDVTTIELAMEKLFEWKNFHIQIGKWFFTGKLQVMRGRVV